MKKDTLKSTLASLAILVAVILWGVTYIFQQDAGKTVDPFLFSSTRMLFGAVIVLPVVFIKNFIKHKKFRFWNPGDNKRETIKGGIILGVFMVLMIASQQWGVAHTTIGKAGFIVSSNVVIVPLLSMFLGQKVRLYQWISIAGAIFGISLLTLTGEGGVNIGDFYMLIAAFTVSISIIITGRFAHLVDVFQLTSIRFIIGGLISLLLAFILGENISMDILKDSLGALMFAGFLGTGVTFTLQALGLTVLDNVSATVIMSLESVFATLSGWIFLDETLTPKELLGCGLVLASTMGMQLYSEFRIQKGIDTIADDGPTFG